VLKPVSGVGGGRKNTEEPLVVGCGCGQTGEGNKGKKKVPGYYWLKKRSTTRGGKEKREKGINQGGPSKPGGQCKQKEKKRGGA